MVVAYQYISLVQLVKKLNQYCMSNKQIAQKVIDFEYSRINAPFEVKKQLPQDYDKYQDRYTKWNLMSILRDLQLGEDYPHVYWVGYGEHTLIEAFTYCLLTAFKVNNEVDNNKFVKTKYSLYQICEKYLSLAEQKQLVQNLCYSQYTKNMANYLNKNCVLEELIQKIYRSHTESFNQVLLPIEELKLFALNFTFLTFQIINDSVALITNFNQKYYIVIQKQCVFVIDCQGDKGTMKSSLRSNQRNSVNGAHYSQNLQCSTPKFIPKDYSQKYSSNKIHHTAVSDPQIIQIANFDREDQFMKPEKLKSTKHIKSKQNSNKKQANGLKKLKSTSPNMSLRHTLDMHIATLQKLDQRRQKSSRKPKTTGFFRESSKDREKSKFTENDSFTSILKSKSSQIKHKSPSPEQNGQDGHNSYLIALKRSSLNTISQPRQSKHIHETSFLKNKGNGTQPKICFTYYSP